MKILTWNVRWAGPKALTRAPGILDRIERHNPEVVCLTEARIDLLQGGDCVVTSQEDYGVRPIVPGRRKVVLWSEQPWRDVEEVGDASLPTGRFVSGVTHTSLGDVTVIGVCIPWADALKRAGHKKWRAHEEYLEGLFEILRRERNERVIVMGDFNQWIGKGRGNAPIRCRDKLRDVFAGRIRIATAAVGFKGRRTIDHIALSDDLVVESLEVVSNIHGERKLSDHFGVAAEVSARHP